MPVKVAAGTADAIKKGKSEGRYLILRHPTFTYSLEDVEVSDDNESVSCTLASVPVEHFRYVNAKPKQYNFSKSRGEGVVLKEMHLYTDRPIAMVDGYSRVVIPLTTINKIEEINYDKRRTKRQHATVLIATAGTVVAGLALAAMAVGSAMAASFGTF